MATLISSGIGSGLDIAGLVQQLVEAEGRPQTVRLDTQEAKAQAKLSALGTLRGALDTFRTSLAGLKDIDKFRGRKVELSDADFVAGTASSAAYPGTYAVTVLELAQSHKLVSAAGAFASKDDAVGTGSLTLSIGGESFTVVIDATHNSLSGIAAAINGSADNTGIAAAVITGVDGARLVLSATETGASHTIAVSQSDGDGGLAALAYDPQALPGENGLSELQAASDARILIDGLEVVSASNTVSDALEGVEIDLLAVHEGSAFTVLTVDFDRAGARAKVEQFVQGYNVLLDAVANVTGFDVEAGTSAPLAGDSSVRGIVTRLRTELNQVLAADEQPFTLLSQIGVTSDLKGKLTIDAARLDAALAEDFDAVGALFAGEDGLATRIDAALEPYVGSGGLIDTRNTGLKATIDAIGDRRSALADRLAAVEQRLFRQFNALDSLLAQLQTTSNFLAQQLSNLPGSRLLDRKD